MLDGREFSVEAGDIVELPICSKHRITAYIDMVIMELQIGESITKVDKTKWEEE